MFSFTNSSLHGGTCYIPSKVLCAMGLHILLPFGLGWCTPTKLHSFLSPPLLHHV